MGLEYVLFLIGTALCVVWAVSAAIVTMFRNRSGG